MGSKAGQSFSAFCFYSILYSILYYFLVFAYGDGVSLWRWPLFPSQWDLVLEAGSDESESTSTGTLKGWLGLFWFHQASRWLCCMLSRASYYIYSRSSLRKEFKTNHIQFFLWVLDFIIEAAPSFFSFLETRKWKDTPTLMGLPAYPTVRSGLGTAELKPVILDLKKPFLYIYIHVSRWFLSHMKALTRDRRSLHGYRRLV